MKMVASIEIVHKIADSVHYYWLMLPNFRNRLQKSDNLPIFLFRN